VKCKSKIIRQQYRALFIFEKINLPVKLIGLLFLFISSYHVGFSQAGILIKNNHTGDTAFYERGTKITYSTKQEGEEIRGWLNYIGDSTLSVDDQTLLIRDIHSIQKKNRGHKMARIAGIPLILLGCIMSGDAIAKMIAKSSSERTDTHLLMGAGLIGLGYLPYLIDYGEYVFDDRSGWVLIPKKK
jgi:hypothetical protein